MIVTLKLTMEPYSTRIGGCVEAAVSGEEGESVGGEGWCGDDDRSSLNNITDHFQSFTIVDY